MDSSTVGYILAAIAGIGGAGLIPPATIASRANVRVGSGSSAGDTGLPRDDQDLPKIPPGVGGCHICPVIFGALLAVILWAAFGPPTPQPAMVIVPAILIGITGGLSGATGWRVIAGQRF